MRLFVHVLNGGDPFQKLKFHTTNEKFSWVLFFIFILGFGVGAF